MVEPKTDMWKCSVLSKCWEFEEGVGDALTRLLLLGASVGLRLPACSSCPRKLDVDNKRTLASCLILSLSLSLSLSRFTYRSVSLISEQREGNC